uniref:Kinesin motor domain-containing protein n=1 Tax=Parascaris univalens TaxID=6257 RepID=A0A915C642_PARUN
MLKNKYALKFAYTAMIRYKLVVSLLFAITVVLFACKMLINDYHQEAAFKSFKNEAKSALFEKYRAQLNKAMENISVDFSTIDCDALFSKNVYKTSRNIAKKYSYRFNKEDLILKSPMKDRCSLIKQIFGFNETPLSKEEEEFPLAYAALVYKWTDEVFYMFSALYHPQNVYCIAIDRKSDPSFMSSVLLLGKCFPNIQIMTVDKVDYCGFSVIHAVVQCLHALTYSNRPWRYFQYLSNFDLPLKTNREMVRIFKRLNGSFNTEILEYPSDRLMGKKVETIPHGIKLYKSSLSATFSRESAEFIVNNEKARSILWFLKGTYCPDESLWTTIAGNPTLRMPNGFDASRWLRAINHNKASISATSFPYYISRFQVWANSKYRHMCKGKFVHASCVYGVDDLHILDERPELIAHKFYLDYQPAAFFCLYRRVRERAIGDIENFNDAVYGAIPGPRVLRGICFSRSEVVLVVYFTNAHIQSLSPL